MQNSNRHTQRTTTIMIRFRNILAIVAAGLVGAAILGAPTRARADFELRYSVNGGPFTTLTTAGGFLTTTIDGFTISATASGNSSTSVTTMDLGVSGAYPAGPALTLVVQAWLNPVVTAPAPQNLRFAFTGSIFSFGTAGTITDETWVTQNSTPFDNTTGLLADTGPHSPTTIGSAGPFNGTVPYSLELGTTINIAAGSGIQSISSDSNAEIVPAPAPASLLLLCTGAPILGLAWLRRRKAEAKAPSLV
jgi:hypothetical protein